MRPKIRQRATDRAIDNSLEAKWSKVRFRDNRVPGTRDEDPALGGGDCWCGEPDGHPWPGKLEGAPHPR